LIVPFLDQLPDVSSSAWVAPNATLVGRVSIAAGASVWYGAVLRGDVVPIRVGERSNIQDLSMIHGNSGGRDVVIGDDVTVGHRVTLHGCTVGHRCLIGMGALVLDDAVIGDECLIAAGALIPPRMVIPPRSFVVGRPGVIKRQVTDDEVAGFVRSAHHYAALATVYAASPGESA
jgi:carbonic anhydrase/acetyltransferase-like protein (isoleucine patch superfamily)